MAGLRTDEPLSNKAGTGPVTLTGQSAAKAFASINGTGTAATRKSLNVSSLTDNGTGDYSLTFTTAMSDANYASVVSGGRGVGSASTGIHAQNDSTVDPTASVSRLMAGASTANSRVDMEYVSYANFGDLA